MFEWALGYSYTLYILMHIVKFPKQNYQQIFCVDLLMYSSIMYFIIVSLFANLSENAYFFSFHIFDYYSFSKISSANSVGRCLHFSYKCERTQYIRFIFFFNLIWPFLSWIFSWKKKESNINLVDPCIKVTKD